MINNVKVLPTFIIPGAPKAGSYSLYHHLNMHPDVFMSPGKEPNFFYRYWDRGIEYCYSCFEGFAGEKAVGEATVGYMGYPEVPARIHSVVPNVRFIWALRNPVKRAYSHYWWRVYQGSETRPFDEVLRGGKEEYPIVYSSYSTSIRWYLDFFPMEQMRFVITERINNRFEEMFSDLFRFLGVDPAIRVQNDGPVNTAKTLRNRALNRVLTRGKAPMKIKRILPAFLREKLSAGLRSLDGWNRKDFNVPPITGEQRERLTEMLLPEISDLEKLLGYDVKEWKKE